MLHALTLSRSDQVAQYGRGATGIYLPPTEGRSALALQLTTPIGRATDAYYQELLGTAMGAGRQFETTSNYQANSRK